MARTVTEIQQEIMDAIAADPVLNVKLYSTSKISIYRLFSFVIAAALWMHETLFDEHKSEVNEILATKKTHNLLWYADKAKEFEHGNALVPDADYYEPIDEDAQIIAHAAVDEINGILFMKVAKDDGDELAPLSTANPDEITPFEEYIKTVKDAGVKINIVSDVGDDLRLNMDIWYNPLVIDEDGKLLTDSSQEPAKDTIKNFIKNIPFDGEFIPASLVDALQATDGIDIPVVKSCESRFAANDYSIVDGKVVPNAGYLVITDDNLTLNYKANVRG
ncbi:MAG: hypothetical protein IMY72_11705 [Bacteroidetes bacterium]|nr:hypothetical protein [Bacteroidota bacterium]